MNLRVVAHIEGIFRHKEVIGNAAAAHRSIASGIVHIQRCAHQTHNGKAILGQLVQGGRGIVVGNHHCLADGVLFVPEAVCQALVGCGGHSALQEHQLVNLAGEGIKAVDGRLRPLLLVHNQIGVKYALCHLHPRELRNGRQLFLVPSVGAEQTQIEHILRIRIGLAGGHHVHFCGTQAHKDACSQSNDHGDGNIAPQGFDNRPAEIPPHHISPHYHSISAMSIGCSLISMLQTVPFFTRITRSAIAVRALLWVMITTVMPVFLPVS